MAELPAGWGPDWDSGGYLTKRWRPLALEPLRADRSAGLHPRGRLGGTCGCWRPGGRLGPRRGAFVVSGTTRPKTPEEGRGPQHPS